MKITHEIKDVRVIRKVTLHQALEVGMHENLKHRVSSWFHKKIHHGETSDAERRFIELTDDLVLQKPYEVENEYSKTMALVTLEKKMTVKEIYDGLVKLDGFSSYPASFSEGMSFLGQAYIAKISVGTVIHLGLQLLDQKTLVQWVPITSGYEKIRVEEYSSAKLFNPAWQVIVIKKDPVIPRKKK